MIGFYQLCAFHSSYLGFTFRLKSAPESAGDGGGGSAPESTDASCKQGQKGLPVLSSDTEGRIFTVVPGETCWIPLHPNPPP